MTKGEIIMFYKEYEKECLGKCAYCGAEIKDYCETEFVDNQVLFHFDCQKCGNSGTEAYKLEYINTLVEVYTNIDE